jgi:hypothetical protein
MKRMATASKAFWVAPPENPEFYKAIRWLERVAESDHPSSPNAQSLLGVGERVSGLHSLACFEDE